MKVSFSTLVLAGGLLSGCSTGQVASTPPIPALDEYCLVAQRIVTRTELPMTLVVRDTFDGFVKSKAIIPEGDNPVPEIQQLNWADDGGTVVGISCKLKSADHLNLVYGEGAAGPDGACQDMNRYVFESLAIDRADYRYADVVFDPREEPQTRDQPPAKGGPGPQWLSEYTATVVDDSGALSIRTKGFIVDFKDPRFARAPARFRGVHYCHFLAPAAMRAAVVGDSEPGQILGQTVDLTGFSAPQ